MAWTKILTLVDFPCLSWENRGDEMVSCWCGNTCTYSVHVGMNVHMYVHCACDYRCMYCACMNACLVYCRSPFSLWGVSIHPEGLMWIRVTSGSGGWAEGWSTENITKPKTIDRKLCVCVCFSEWSMSCVCVCVCCVCVCVCVRVVS